MLGDLNFEDTRATDLALQLGAELRPGFWRQNGFVHRGFIAIGSSAVCDGDLRPLNWGDHWVHHAEYDPHMDRFKLFVTGPNMPVCLENSEALQVALEQAASVPRDHPLAGSTAPHFGMNPPIGIGTTPPPDFSGTPPNMWKNWQIGYPIVSPNSGGGLVVGPNTDGPTIGKLMGPDSGKITMGGNHPIFSANCEVHGSFEMREFNREYLQDFAKEEDA